MEWQDYEKIVLEECRRVFRNADISHNVHIKGLYSKRMRQIDVLVQTDKGTVYVVDAKKYGIKVDVKTVESFIGMVKDVGGNYGIIVSEKGFTKAAINRAHYGEDNIEIDILNLHELSMFQSEWAIPYAGNNGVIALAPFCWVIDGARRNNMVAVMYRRGFSFEEAAKNKEWAYINFWDKSDEICTLDELISWQNSNLLCDNNNGTIEEICSDLIRIRIFNSPNYPTPEITLFREFDDFFLFVVLFSPNNMISKNIEKMKYFLINSTPIHVEQNK
ncbi:MAG: restriction endonuclease [Paludibacteraceae bacterium]|nr:restriction endonuclease [Paludibacteraceae bacterium]